jgi:hypothetical protein
MSKNEEQQQQHILNPAQDDNKEDEGNKGTGGLLSGIADPIGTFSSLPVPFPTLSNTSYP